MPRNVVETDSDVRPAAAQVLKLIEKTCDIVLLSTVIAIAVQTEHTSYRILQNFK